VIETMSRIDPPAYCIGAEAGGLPISVTALAKSRAGANRLRRPGPADAARAQ
jgi:hypothetical protein